MKKLIKRTTSLLWFCWTERHNWWSIRPHKYWEPTEDYVVGDWFLVQCDFTVHGGWPFMWHDKCRGRPDTETNKDSPWWANMAQKERLKHGNNPSSVCLHRARCCVPTLWGQYGISKLHKCTSLAATPSPRPLQTSNPALAYCTWKQMLGPQRYPHGTDAMPCHAHMV